MSIVQNQICDACGALLTAKGHDGTIRRDAIEIKGQVIAHVVDPETGWREHTFISPTSNSDLSFCDLECFGYYIERQKQHWRAKRVRELRDQAGNEQIDRLATGYTGRYSDKRPATPPNR